MFEFLSEGEKNALNLIKERYDAKPTTTIGIIEPIFDVEIKEDCMASLQEKGYWDIKRESMGNNTKMIVISLKDKFFTYFNIKLEK